MMMKTRSETDTVSEDKERLINNIDIDLVVDEQSAPFINNNGK